MSNQNLSPNDKKAIEKLSAILEKVEIFDKDEVVKIREMITIYESFVAFGIFATSARKIFVFGGSLAAIWLAANSWILTAIKKMLVYIGGS